MTRMSSDNDLARFKKSFGKELLRRLLVNYEQYLMKKGLPPYLSWKKQLESLIDGILELLVKDHETIFNKETRKDRFTRRDYLEWAMLGDDVMSFSEWLESMGLKEYLLQQLGVDEISEDLLDF